MKRLLLFLLGVLVSIGIKAEDFSWVGGSITIDGTTATVTVTQQGTFSTWLGTNSSALSSVEKVVFSSSSTISDGDINALSGIVGLKEIDATGCFISNADNTGITITIGNVTTLTLENVSYANGITNLPFKITGCNNLIKLNMKGISIQGTELTISNNNSLTNIDLSGANITVQNVWNDVLNLNFSNNAKLETLTLAMMDLLPVGDYASAAEKAKIDISNTALKGLIMPEGVKEENLTSTNTELNYKVSVAYSTKEVTANLLSGGHMGEVAKALNISGETDFSRLNIIGELNSDDFTAMKDINIQIPIIDLSGRTLADDVMNEHYNFGGNTYVEYVILPSDWSTKKSWTISESDFEGCTSLKVALSLSDDKTELNAYSTKAGGLRDGLNLTSFKVNEYNYSAATLTKVTLSGYMNGADISNSVFNSTEEIDNISFSPALSSAKLEYLDLTNAIFETYATEIEVTPEAYNEKQTEKTNGLANIKMYSGSLKYLILPMTSETEILPANALDKCTLLEGTPDTPGTLIIPQNIKTIGTNACLGLSKISQISIYGVEHLGIGVFRNCTSLTSVNFPSTMNYVPEYTFSSCTSLFNVSLPEGLEEIRENAFSLTNINTIYLPSTLKKIGNQAFQMCYNIKTIIIPANVESIGSQAFNLCSALRDVYVLGTTKIPEIAYNTFDVSSMYGGSTGIAKGAYADITSTWDGEKNIHVDTGYVLDEAYTSKAAHNEPLCLFHYPVSLNKEEDGKTTNPYTDIERNNNYDLEAVTSLEGNHEDNRVLVEGGTDGQYLRRPSTADLTEIKTKYAAEDNTKVGTQWWQYFALAQGYTTGGDNSSVWTIRHMNKDVWYTMCFPFDLTRQQLKETFNFGCELAEFAGINTETIDGVDYTYLDFTTNVLDWNDNEAATTVVAKAGHPYMIHPASGYDAAKGTGVVFTITGISANYEEGPFGKEADGYTFIGSYGTAINSGEKFVDVYDEYPDAVAEDGFKTYIPGENGMPQGLLVPKPIAEGDYFLGTKSGDTYPKFFKEMSKDMERSTGLWTRFTAVIKVAKDEDAEGVKELGINFGDFDNSDVVITRIKDVCGNVLEENVIKRAALLNNVYNMKGQLVRSGSTNLEGLSKGIYMVNGKKYVVK